MPKQKVSRLTKRDSIINVCDTTTLPPAFEQENDPVKSQSLNNEHRRIPRKQDKKHAISQYEKYGQEVPVHSYRFEPYSNAPDIYCLNRFVNGMNTSGEGDQDFSSDDEYQDPLHQQYSKHSEETGHGINDDGRTNSPTAQETSGSKSKVPEEIRLRINSRERQRMHDLNSALDSLRQVMPYSSGPSVKKLSKMSTLLLARNYIVMLTRSVEDMKRLVQEMSSRRQLPPPPPPPPTTLPLPPPSSTAPPTSISQPHLSALSSLPLISNPSAYAALLSGHSTTPAGLFLPSSIFQIPQLLPAAALAHHHHHHIAGIPGCPCYYCKKLRSAVPTS